MNSLTLLEWTSILVLISVVLCGYLILKSAVQTKSLPTWLFLFSVLFLASSNITFLIDDEFTNWLKWFNLLSLVSVLSGLFAYVRESKPVFARFPLYLVFIPFFTPFFYPLIIDTYVISNLLMGAYQVGAVIVGLMMLFIKQSKEGDHIYEIAGMLFFSVAIALRWFEIETIPRNIELAEVMLSAGLIVFTKGIYTKINIQDE